METNIAESIVYNDAEEKSATSLDPVPRVTYTAQELSNFLDDSIDRESTEYIVHALGKMYRNSVPPSAKSSDILSHLIDCYHELLKKELQYNNSKEKIETIKLSIKNIQNSLEILKLNGYECDRDKFKSLIRAFSL